LFSYAGKKTPTNYKPAVDLNGKEKDNKNEQH
jgi:hypothetical protein